MDELACFVPGMLALGSSGYGPEDSKKFLTLAEEVLSKLLAVLRDFSNTSFSSFSQAIVFFKCHNLYSSVFWFRLKYANLC